MVPAGDLAGLARSVAEDIATMGANIGYAGELPIRIGEEHGFLQPKLQKGKGINLLREGYPATVPGKLPGFGKNLLNQLVKHFLGAVKGGRQGLSLRNVRVDNDGFQISFYLNASLNYSF